MTTLLVIAYFELTSWTSLLLRNRLQLLRHSLFFLCRQLYVKATECKTGLKWDWENRECVST